MCHLEGHPRAMHSGIREINEKQSVFAIAPVTIIPIIELTSVKDKWLDADDVANLRDIDIFAYFKEFGHLPHHFVR